MIYPSKNTQLHDPECGECCYEPYVRLCHCKQRHKDRRTELQSYLEKAETQENSFLLNGNPYSRWYLLRTAFSNN